MVHNVLRFMAKLKRSSSNYIGTSHKND